jgi:hypothetical protein
MITIVLATLLLTCKQSVLPVLKPMPQLEYPCDESANAWDEKILKDPARVAAIKSLMTQLSSFSNAAWWQASTNDLNACDAAGKEDYVQWLFGSSRIRLVLIPDPCYQTEYGGSNAFLLHRKGDRVFVTQALDGYFSRADNSVGIAFAKFRGEDIVEVSTGSGGLNPTLTNYYFRIDPKTNQAIPENLFKGEHGPTNEITSAMLFGDSWGFAAPLRVIRAGGTLAPSFTIYEDDENGRVDDNGRKLSRRILRWNGKMYR